MPRKKESAVTLKDLLKRVNSKLSPMKVANVKDQARQHLLMNLYESKGSLLCQELVALVSDPKLTLASVKFFAEMLAEELGSWTNPKVAKQEYRLEVRVSLLKIVKAFVEAGAKFKAVIGSKIITALIKIIDDKSAEILLKNAACEVLIELLTHCKENKEFMNNIDYTFGRIASLIAKAVLVAGDYELQTLLVEILFRVFPRTDEKRAQFVQDCFKNWSENAIYAFASLSSSAFGKGCRECLNVINCNDGMGKSVDHRPFSFIAAKVAYEGSSKVELSPDRTIADHFYVDFNKNSISLIYSSKDGDPSIVSLLYENIRGYKIETPDGNDLIRLSLHLKYPIEGFQVQSMGKDVGDVQYFFVVSGLKYWNGKQKISTGEVRDLLAHHKVQKFKTSISVANIDCSLKRYASTNEQIEAMLSALPKSESSPSEKAPQKVLSTDKVEEKEVQNDAQLSADSMKVNYDDKSQYITKDIEKEVSPIVKEKKLLKSVKYSAKKRKVVDEVPEATTVTTKRGRKKTKSVKEATENQNAVKDAMKPKEVIEEPKLVEEVIDEQTALPETKQVEKNDLPPAEENVPSVPSIEFAVPSVPLKAKHATRTAEMSVQIPKVGDEQTTPAVTAMRPMYDTSLSSHENSKFEDFLKTINKNDRRTSGSSNVFGNTSMLNELGSNSNVLGFEWPSSKFSLTNKGSPFAINSPVVTRALRPQDSHSMETLFANLGHLITTEETETRSKIMQSLNVQLAHVKTALLNHVVNLNMARQKKEMQLKEAVNIVYAQNKKIVAMAETLRS